MSFPYTDPRTDNQLDMDPCKSGKKSRLGMKLFDGITGFETLWLISQIPA